MKTYETYNEPSEWSLNIRKEPGAFNGMVQAIRYRVTVEPIEEAAEVIHARLEKLWLECDNWHERTPLEREAKKHGYVFKGTFGELRKRP